MTDTLISVLWRASWQASVLFVVVVLFVKLTPRISSSIHCWAYRLVCAKFLLALFVVGAVELPLLPSPRVSQPPTDITAAEFSSSETANTQVNAVEEIATADVPSMKPTTGPVPVETSTHSGVSWPRILVAAWILGVLWQLTRFVSDAIRLWKIRRSAEQLTDHPAERLLRQETINLRLAQCPELCVASTTNCPAVLGLFSTCIVLPDSVLQQASEDHLRLLLRHELAHLSRRDLWWNWLAAVTQLLFFFHPVVWVTLKEWRMHQESACDQMAIGSPPVDAAEYASLLMEIALTKKPSASLAYAAGIFESFETLKRRIEKMSDFGSCSQRYQIVAAAAAVIISIAGLTPWKLVPVSAAAMPVATAKEYNSAGRKIDVDNSDATITKQGYKISIADVSNLSRLKHRRLTDFSKIQMIPSGTQSELSEDSVQKEKGNGNAFASASGGGFAGGAGGVSHTTFEGPPTLGVALNIGSQSKGERFTLVDALKAVGQGGKSYKSLPTSGVSMMVIPEYETAHAGGLTVYFPQSALKAKSFKTLQGQLLIETVDVDEVEFSRIRENAQKQTSLGEYVITKVQNVPDKLQVTIRCPLPVSIRDLFSGRPTSAEHFRKMGAARHQILGMIRVTFVDADGNEYQPNTTTTHNSPQSNTTTTEKRSENGFSSTRTTSSSSQKEGTREAMYGINKIPGVKFTGVRVRVSELPTKSKTVDFELKNVKLKG